MLQIFAILYFEICRCPTTWEILLNSSVDIECKFPPVCLLAVGSNYVVN